MTDKPMLPLTEPEQQVLAERHTEAPFSGRFLVANGQGQYCCRRCGSALYPSASKFDAGCGWPAFDQALPGAVEEWPDADGHRVEIRCHHCGGHLGHVFYGEGFSARNERHCVNGLALAFLPQTNEGQQIAVFGGGCFWCLEAIFQRMRGVLSVRSGYCGGRAERANYAQVCGGNSQHIEVVQLQYDPQQISYSELLEVFFDLHDATSWDQQGNDRGSQYRSVIFAQTPAQQQQAERFMQALQPYRKQPIVTEIRAAMPFYVAEPEHQNYFNQHPQAGYCHYLIGPKLAQLARKYADRITP